MDELTAFIRERLTEIDLELRLNPDDGMFASSLYRFVTGLRLLLDRYGKESAGSVTDSQWLAYAAGLEDAIRWQASVLWHDHPDYKPEWPN